MNTQWWLMVAISLLVGLASAGLVWTGADLILKVRAVLAVKLAERKRRAEEAAAAAKKEEEE